MWCDILSPVKEMTSYLPTPSGEARYFRGKELKELTDGQAKFLAGIFEVAGGISMRISDVKRRASSGFLYEAETVDSLIQYSDNDEAKIEALKEMFGGDYKKHPTEQSWKWHTGGRVADNLLGQIKPFAPMRRYEIEIHNRVYATRDIDERKCLVAAFNEYKRTPQSFPDVEEYKALVVDPDFLRGVYAGRGADYSFEQDAPLRFWTQNISLLAALGEPYGLEPYPIVNTRVPRHEGARIPVSFRLEMNNGPKKHFLTKIGADIGA